MQISNRDMQVCPICHKKNEPDAKECERCSCPFVRKSTPEDNL